MATIITKNSSTASSVPTAAQLVQGELAVNVTDKRLFTENASGTVVELGTNPSSLTLPNGTANGVAYLNGSKVLTTGTGLQFDGSNLGLGVTPSAWSGYGPVFQMKNGGGLANNTGEDVHVFNNCYYNGSNWRYITSTTASRYEQYLGGHYWMTAPSGTAGNAISFTQAMTLDASGRLGIGETSPGYRVSVRGTAGSTGHTECLIQVGTDADVYSAQAQIRLSGKYGDAGYAYIAGLRPSGGTATDNALVFGTVATERARIDSSGNLLVGLTSSLYGGVICTSGNITVGGNQLNFDNGNSTIEFVNRNSAGSKTFSWYYQASAAGSPATLSTSGVWTNASDARGKENISDIHYGLDTVMALQPRQYDVKSDGSHAIGFVAQEVLPVVPELVHVTRRTENDEFYGLDYGSMTAVLVKAIQEQQAIINAQSAALEQLKADVAALKGAA